MADRANEVSQAWSWHVRLNAPRGWRQRLAQWLHGLAVRIDRRACQVWEINTEPPLAPSQRKQLMEHSYRAMCTAVQSETRSEAQELCLRKLHPELYPHGQAE